MNRVARHLIIALIVIAGCLRFVALEEVPPGVFPDEAALMTHLICLDQRQSDAFGSRWPLFTDAYEPATQHEFKAGTFAPTQLYFGLLWVKAFGYSISSARAFNGFAGVTIVVGVFLFTRLLLGLEAGLWAALAAALSPWGFVAGRFATTTTLAPALLSLGIYFFLRSTRPAGAVASGVLLSLAIYTYPTLRVQVPLVFLGLIWIRTRLVAPFDLRFCAWAAGSAVVSTLPLVAYLVSGQGLERFQYLSIANHEVLARTRLGASAVSLAWIFLKNIARHFSPRFLFISGDANLRHSTQWTGELSWLESLAIVAGVGFYSWQWLRRKEIAAPEKRALRVALFCFLGYLFSVMPAAMTWEGQPHALRSIGALPFVACLAGTSLASLQRRWSAMTPLALIVSMAFLAGFAHNYFSVYREESRPYWRAEVLDAAKESQRTGDWTVFRRAAGSEYLVASRYYLIQYAHSSCAATQSFPDSVP
jgi:4-amino-4-deoxy-L-arabinose transferase-like glycosyltransferase